MSNAQSLLPFNASELEKTLEQVMCRAFDLPVDIDKLWNPATCPEHILPWLAWALSVDSWEANWPTEVKRNIIAASIDVHRHKGTLAAIKNQLNALEIDYTLVEWFRDADLPPYTFNVLVELGNDIPVPELIKTIRTVVENAKNARSHIASLQLATNIPEEIDIHLGAALSYGVNARSVGGDYHPDDHTENYNIEYRPVFTGVAVSYSYNVRAIAADFDPDDLVNSQHQS